MKTKEELIQFEEDVIEMYKQGKLRSPIHLSRGNEEQLIEIFKDIKPNDWVFSTYRSHYHALLKGINEYWLKNWILNNKSIHVMNKEHKFITSAIVGGCVPMALGVAMALNKKFLPDKAVTPHVWLFCGDMTSESGGFYEAWKYACAYDLPIIFVIEDNGLSTDTPTLKVWGMDIPAFEGNESKIKRYKYTRGLPHYGCGIFVDFKDESLKQEGKF